MAIEQLLHIFSTSSFRFLVSVDGIPMGAFTECVLPSLEIDIEEVKEGGLNTMVHHLPGRRKAAKLTLKNGIGIAHELMSWYLKTMHGSVSRRRVTVVIYTSYFAPIMAIDIQDAFPTKWEGPQLKSDDDTIAISTLELVCGEVLVA